MTRPSLGSKIARGVSQVRKYGLRLLWHRYVTANKVLRMEPVPCLQSAPLEIHMQICQRDWKNGIWTVFSFAHFVKKPFRLLILSHPPIDHKVKSVYTACFPGVEFSDELATDKLVEGKFSALSPTLLKLWLTRRFFTLPKIIESTALARQSKILTLDPDVVFFSSPAALLNEIDLPVTDFALLNSLRSDPPHRDGSYAIDADRLTQDFAIELPLNFGTGLGVICPSLYPWEIINEILDRSSFLPQREFMLDQTIIALACVSSGFRRLPVSQYVIEKPPSLDGVIARHYYAKTRDEMYVEAMPILWKKFNEN